MMENLDSHRVPAQAGGPRIVVIGVGGAGGNAINNMIQGELAGVEFLVANTDAQAIGQSLCEHCIQLGRDITQGLGAGSRPDVGRAAAEEGLDEILQTITGAHMVFITAGMGGGTGTGAAPVFARAAREVGILTVGVVTTPFDFEGAHRMRLAEAGIAELTHYVDTLIVIPNQNLFRVANEKTTFADAFKMADDVLNSGVRGVTDLMVLPGLINLDFADIRSVMTEMGHAIMGTGEAEGENRAIAAAEAAISNPLLDHVSMKGARGVLINITGALDMTLFEVDEAANRIRDEVDPEANIIFGSTFNQELEGRIRVSVVATGIAAIRDKQPKATPLSLVVNAPGAGPADQASATRDPAPEIVAAATEIVAARSEITGESKAGAILEAGDTFDSSAPKDLRRNPWLKPAFGPETEPSEPDSSSEVPSYEVPAFGIRSDQDPPDEIPDSKESSKEISDDENSSSQLVSKQIESSAPGLEQALDGNSLDPPPSSESSWWGRPPLAPSSGAGGPTPLPPLPEAPAETREIESEPANPPSLETAPVAAFSLPGAFEERFDADPKPQTMAAGLPEPGSELGIDSGHSAPPQLPTAKPSPGIDPVSDFPAPPEFAAVEEPSPGIDSVPDFPAPTLVENPVKDTVSAIPPTPPVGPKTPPPTPSRKADGLFSWVTGSAGDNPEGVFEEGEAYYYGQGIARNLKLAFRSYHKAAEMGHAAAQNRLGWMYEKGEGCAAEYTAAVAWHRKSAEQGYVNAMNDLGYMYRQGWGVEQNHAEALYWFGSAAAKYDSYAEYNMGQMYENGWGVKKDAAEAIRWFRRSAARGHEWAAKRLEELGVPS